MLTEARSVYKCEFCGIISQVLHGGDASMVCCGRPMKHLKENTVDASKEKHVPVVEKVAGGITVKVGSVPHPMEADHWIEFIEVIAGNKVCRVELKPGEAPEAFFPVQDTTRLVVREYCNKHGLWKS